MSVVGALLATVLATPLLLAAYIFWVAVLPAIQALPRHRQLKASGLQGPEASFLLGNSPQLIARPVHQQVLDWVRQYGPIFRLAFPGISAVVVTDPETAVRLLKEERLPKFSRSYVNFRKLTTQLHDNILTEGNTPYWRAVRRAVTPAFSTSNLKHLLPEVVSSAQHVVRHLHAVGEGHPVDVDRLAQRITVDVVGRFAFDRDFAATRGLEGAAPPTATSASEPPSASTTNEALAAIEQLLSAMQSMINPLNRWFPWRKAGRAFWSARCRFDSIICRTLDDLRARPPASHSLMAHLMSMTDPNTGKPLSQVQLKCETAIFWIAGFETTAHSLAWTVMYISTHPEVEARVAAELDELGLLASPTRPEPRPLAWGDLGALRYLNACIHEALRLMPAASGGAPRVATRDMTILGHSIPKDTMIWMPFYSMHRAPHVWSDPDAFKPERWLGSPQQRGSSSGETAGAGGGGDTDGDGMGAVADEVVRAAGTTAVRGGVIAEQPSSSGETAGAGGGGDTDGDGMGAVADEVVRAAGTTAARGWMPFSEGPRNCVGMSLALMEMRAVLAILCGRFRFRLSDDMGTMEDVVSAARQHITLKPGEKGLLMHAVPRGLPA